MWGTTINGEFMLGQMKLDLRVMGSDCEFGCAKRDGKFIGSQVLWIYNCVIVSLFCLLDLKEIGGPQVSWKNATANWEG